MSRSLGRGPATLRVAEIVLTLEGESRVGLPNEVAARRVGYVHHGRS